MNDRADRAHRVGGDVTAMAFAATLHCLTGCAIGEIAGLTLGAATGLDNTSTIAISVILAFLFGFGLSTLPMLRSGLTLRAAVPVVLAADTLSIATMEIVDNAVMAVLPGAMDARLVDGVFWIGMIVSLAAAFVVAVPVNRWLLRRGKGHALTHAFHAMHGTAARRRIPVIRTSSLAAALVAFLLGGLLVSTANELTTAAF